MQNQIIMWILAILTTTGCANNEPRTTTEPTPEKSEADKSDAKSEDAEERTRTRRVERDSPFGNDDAQSDGDTRFDLDRFRLEPIDDQASLEALLAQYDQAQYQVQTQNQPLEPTFFNRLMVIAPSLAQLFQMPPVYAMQSLPRIAQMLTAGSLNPNAAQSLQGLLYSMMNAQGPGNAYANGTPGQQMTNGYDPQNPSYGSYASDDYPEY